MEISGVILAGGLSSRMGTNKAFLTVNNRTLIENTINELKQFCSEIIIVTNEAELYKSYSVEVIKDVFPGKGPLSGIHAGLLKAANFYSLMVACDMPFISWQLGRFMAQETQENDVIIPKIGEHLQPLFAIYSKDCLPSIEDCLKKDIKKVITFYKDVKVKYIGEEIIKTFGNEEKTFFNLNTPEDLERAKNW